jgi:hypothetical protein
MYTVGCQRVYNGRHIEDPLLPRRPVDSDGLLAQPGGLPSRYSSVGIPARGLRPFLNRLKQFRERDPQGLRNLLQVAEAHVRLTPLQSSDVRAMNASSIRKALLRVSGALAQLANPVSQGPLQLLTATNSSATRGRKPDAS